MPRLAYLASIARFVVLALGLPAVPTAKTDPYVRAALQATMQQHIDRNLVQGAYLHLDTATGNVVELYPVSPHPVIMRMGSVFVLCADFRKRNGVTVNVDFYLAKDNHRYVVFHAAVDQRHMLEKWMKAGKVARLD